MKKLFVSVLAIVSMVACMNDEIVSVQKGNPIAFDSFVENATRANEATDPSTTTGSLYGFNVWGFMDETTGILFKGDEVTGGQGNYSYTYTQYWLPGHDYYFAALAPIGGNWALDTTKANKLGAGVVSFTNVDGTEDLLYAAKALENVSDNPGPVKFQFHHLLSKVKFTFENDFTNPKNNIVVSKVKMTAPAAGTIDLAVENWRDNNDDWALCANANGEETVELAFGDAGEIAQGKTQESAYECFTIPASAGEEYEVSFTVDLYMDELYAETYNLTVNVKGIALEMGKAYNFKASIDAETLELDEIVFDVDEVEGWDEGGQIISNETDLQAALDAAPADKTTVINLGANIEGDVTDVQKQGRNVVINGNGYKYNGTIKVHSYSEHYTDAALTIKNLNFETSTASVNFIEALENGSERYSCNITVENCTFTATGAAVNTAVGVQIKASKNAKVIGCTATGVHSLIQAQSCDESVLVQNCTVTGKNGVAFKQVKNAVVEGTTITAAAYGIRFDGNTDNYGITVKDNEVTASQPFIVRKMTGKDNTIALDGTNTLTVSAASISTETPAYQIIITNGSDDEAYVKPTGTYTLTGADNYLVYPRDVYFLVATWDEFTSALAANEPKIKLTDNIEYSGNYSLQKDVVIDLNGKSITMPMFYVFSTATIKNGTINGKMYARTGCKATLEGLTFSGTISDDLSTEGHLQVQGSCDVYAKNCTFAATTVNGSQTRSLSIEGSSSGIRKFEGCDFKFVSFGTGAGKYKKNVYINTMNGTTTVDFTDCKLNGKAPNILFAGTYSLKNLTMSGCDNTAPTLEISRAKDTVTEEEWAHISSLIANNKFTQVRVFYAGGSSEYIR